MRRQQLVPILVLASVIATTSPATAEFLGVSPSAFIVSSAAAGTTMAGSSGHRVSVASGCEYAPVQLPSGSILSALTFWVRDNDAEDGITLTLWEKNTTTNSAAVALIQGTSAGTNPVIRAVIATDPTPSNVDPVNETFYLEACYGDVGLELHHVAITYTGPPTGISTSSPVVVPAAAFRTVSGRPAILVASEGYLMASFFNGGFATDCTVAPVNLPDGTTLDSLRATLFDSRAESNVAIQLRRKRLNTNQASEVIAEVTTTGTSGHQQVMTSSFTAPIVDHAYSYFLATTGPCPVTDSTQRIYAVRVYHTEAIFTDGFESGDTSAWSLDFDRLLIPAAAFLPAASGAWNTHPVDVATGRLNFQDASCAFAPVTVPNGATLSLLGAYVVDPDPSRSITVRLRVKNDNGASASQIAAVTSTGSVGPTPLLALLSTTVDTAMNHYYLEVCGPAGATPGAFAIQGALIDYLNP